jgi:ureidoglycolate hydrolase
MELRAEALTAQAFHPFGRVIERPARAGDATGPRWRWWADTALMDDDHRAYGIGYLALEPGELAFDWAERHMRTVEVVLPLGGDCLVYVGPPQHRDEPARAPRRDLFRVFRVTRGQGVLLDRAVWHGAPLALGHALDVVVVLLQDTGKTDTSLVRFDEGPIQVTL